MIKAFIQALLFAAPWPVRRRLLRALFGYEIAPTARIGFSLILADRVTLKEGSRIGSLTLIKGIQSIFIDEFASLGSLNWVTGFPRGNTSHFTLEKDRRASLHLHMHSAITGRHLIDCTDRVTIGAFTTVGGWRSQILTHAIDLRTGRQSCAPVTIGRYCFVGTGAILLKGSCLPDKSVLAAGSVLTRAMTEENTVYGGVPANAIRPIDAGAKYFTRSVGFVY